jgi:hypothetical protein
LLAQNGIYAAIFNEQRCGASVELKIAEEKRFQPTACGAAKMIVWFVERLDRTACTLFAFLLPYNHFGFAQNMSPDWI